MKLVVFSTALLTLSVEVFYTRLFSALFWKNIALAILSLAMLGIGTSGVLVYLLPAWFSPKRMTAQIAWLVGAFGLSIVASYSGVLELSQRSYNALEPLGSYVALVGAGLIPFFFGGLVLSIIFTHCADRIATLYWFDLVGAAVGAVLALPLLQALNGPMIVPVLALAAVLSGVWFAWRNAQRAAAWAGAGAALGLVVLIAMQARGGVLDVKYSHGQPEGELEFEHWDPLARMTVHSHEPQTKWLNIDSQVQTPVLRYGDGSDASFLTHNVLQLAYRLRPYAEVLIIGPGGGSDVLAALVAGNRRITGVEVNRTTIRLMKHELREFNGGLYHQPGVEIRIADGRAYVAAMANKVDLIQATFVDTFTASAAGHTLSENYLYTVEGLHDFLDHLNEGGILSLSRWGGEAFSFAETHRAAALAQRALEERHVARPGDHVVAVQGAPPARLVRGGGYQNPNNLAESMSTLLIKASPFGEAELDVLARASEESSFRVLWLGARRGQDTTLTALFEAKDRPAFFANYAETTGLDITPVTDDRPFFFDMLDPIRSLFRYEHPEWSRHIYYFARSVDIRMLHELLGATLVLALALLVVPLLLRLRDVRGVRRPVSTIGYFMCLGVGFIGIEITLMQRFALFLEHPVYSLVVFLSSILLFAGIGSARSKKLAGDWQQHAPRRALALLAVLCLYGVGAAPLTRALMGLPLVAKMLLAAALAFPPGYLMGMMFPLGIAAIRKRAEPLVPWVWGLNSAFSVLGGVLSLSLAMSFGYTVTWFLFVSAYALAFFAMRRMATA